MKIVKIAKDDDLSEEKEIELLEELNELSNEELTELFLESLEKEDFDISYLISEYFLDRLLFSKEEKEEIKEIFKK